MHACTRWAAQVTLAIANVGLAGCATPAPDYLATPDHVAQLKRSGAAPTHVSFVATQPGLPGARFLKVRTQQMRSPTGFDFGDYVAAALRTELQAAQLDNPASATEITGTLVQNQLDASGVKHDDGSMDVRFMVTRGPLVVFDKVKSVTYQWPGTADNTAAIPGALRGYTAMVRALMASLIADPDFIAALTVPSSSQAGSSSAE